MKLQLEFRIKRHSRMLAEGINLLCGSIRVAWRTLIHILMGYQVVRWLLQFYENVTNSDKLQQQQQVQRGLGANAREGEEEAAGREEETEDKECLKISSDNRNIVNATAVMGNAVKRSNSSSRRSSNASNSSSRGSSNSRSRSNSTRNKSVQKRHSEV